MTFEKSVFINCPFDKDYSPLLDALLFCCIYLGFHPRLATERQDSAENRLSKICELIQSSKFSIHDLSRNRAAKAGDFARMNMPFELGIDYACRRFSNSAHAQKRILILDEKKYQYQIAISDLAGCDPASHSNDFEKLIRVVRNWLVSEANATPHSPTRITIAYYSFQEWNWERLTQLDFSHTDIQERPKRELIDEMTNWVIEGMPPSYN